MEAILTIFALVGAGIFIGAASGLLGIGGGSIMVPMLRLCFGLPAIMSTATSLFAIIWTSLSGSVTHIRNKTCYPKLGVALGLGGALTSAIGVLLASLSPSWLIMLAAACVIIYSAFSMLKKALALPKDTSRHQSTLRQALKDSRFFGCRRACEPAAEISRAEQHESATDHAPTNVRRAHKSSNSDPSFGMRALLGAFVIGMIAGLASGYVGVGGGFVMVPMMIAFLEVPVHKASGTSLVAIIILAIPGAIEQMMLGNVDYLAGVILAAGSIPGAYLGARLVVYVPERRLAMLFSAFLFVASAFLVLNELNVV